MMRKSYLKRFCLLVICVGAAFTTVAGEYTPEDLISSKEKINSAIVKFEKTERERWSYSISRYENEEGDITSSIEQYSPPAYSDDAEPWLLKRINGELPTNKQMNNFAKKKLKQSNAKEQGSNIQLKLRELINEESLSLVSTDDKYIFMAFKVNLKKLGEDSTGKLQGQLTYQKENQFIEKISIWNNAEFSPMFTANITDLAITFTFVEINGAILTKQNEMKMKGSFAYFTEINETSLDSFSDYQYQGK
mgnify:CR=1 FL=1